MAYAPLGNLWFRNALNEILANGGFNIGGTRRTLEYLADNGHLGLALLVQNTDGGFQMPVIRDTATTVQSVLTSAVTNANASASGLRVYQISSGTEWGTAGSAESGRIIAPAGTSGTGTGLTKLTLNTAPVWTNLAKDYQDDGAMTTKEAIGCLVYAQATAAHGNSANASDLVIGFIDEGGFPLMGSGTTITLNQGANGFLSLEDA